MKNERLNACIDQLESMPFPSGPDFLLTWKRTTDELRALLAVAEALEELYQANVSTRMFDAGLAVSIFRDQSTRTRFSFASAAALLGLQIQELDEKKSQIAHGETVRETATMISFLTEAIGIRDDMFLGQGHQYMSEVAGALDDAHKHGVLAQRPAVINLQCDLDHPTQSMADLLHLKQIFGSLDALKGRKLAMTWAYSPSYGKPLSVPQGIIALMTRFGMDVTLAHPPGYELVPEVLKTAAGNAEQSGGRFRQVDNLAEAFDGADIVYPKSWAPLSIMQERTRLRATGESDKLDALEAECLSMNARHVEWECNDRVMERTRIDAADASLHDLTGGQALYMHCLPADISGVSCKQGEVSADVFDRYRLATYKEASHKPFIIAAMIMLGRCDHPAETLRRIASNATRRKT